MTWFRYVLYSLILIPLFIVLFWIFAIPESFIKTQIEDSLSNHGSLNTEVNVNGLKKGIFFTVSADSIELTKDNIPSLRMTEISSRINPLYLLKKKLAFSINGKIGTGDVIGFMRLPDNGKVKIDKAEINAIPYLSSLGLNVNGSLSADINLENNVLDVLFKTSRVEIEDSLIMIPLPLNSFKTIQGVFNIQGNMVNVQSISLDADKGYARIKGNIANGFMNLVLELMPSVHKLNSMETMMISRYQVSPGYYVIPIQGPLLF